MELTKIFGRNFNINKDMRKRYDKLQTNFIFKDRDAKDIFMICLGLGFLKNHREEVKNPVGLLNTSSFEDDDLWTIAAVAVKSNGDLSILGKGAEVKKIASEYSYGGLSELETMDNDYTAEDLANAIEKKAKDALKKATKN
jgi:hypothetical protein